MSGNSIEIKMEYSDKIKGMRTCAKMFFNVVERLEVQQNEPSKDDWKVGVKCSSEEKQNYVHAVLHSMIQNAEVNAAVVKLEDYKVEVCPLISTVQSLDKEVLDKLTFVEMPPLGSPDSGTSASSSLEDFPSPPVGISMEKMSKAE